MTPCKPSFPWTRKRLPAGYTHLTQEAYDTAVDDLEERLRTVQARFATLQREYQHMRAAKQWLELQLDLFAPPPPPLPAPPPILGVILGGAA